MIDPVRSKDNFLIYCAPKIEQDEINEVVEVMKSGWLGTGPRTAAFENAFCTYKNAKYAVALNSCTAALHLSLIAAGIKEGDEVITTPMTFCATVNSIIHAGGTPVLADINPVTLNIDPSEILKKITSRTKVILPVHFAGLPCEMDEIMKIANNNSLTVIEDCAHAIETLYKGKEVGTIGDFGCISFYVTKNIVTGEGGMVLVKNEKFHLRLKRLSLHGMDKDAWKRFGNDGYKHYDVLESGFKYNMMDLQAGIGLHQLKRVENYWEQRETIWNFYKKNLSDLPIILPSDCLNQDDRHAYHLFTIQLDKDICGISRDEFINKMTYHNIGVGVHYRSIPEYSFYSNTFNWKPEQFPNAYKVGKNTVSLPISASMCLKDMEDVVKAVRLIIKNN
jgi:dTDP-4-amino-4,6-dideoxygalactose transaminase